MPTVLVAGGSDVRCARQEFAPHYGDLTMRQVGPEAEVRARGAQAVVIVEGQGTVREFHGRLVRCKS